MKIVVVCPALRRALKSPKKIFGGIERHVTEISMRLIKLGYEIMLPINLSTSLLIYELIKCQKNI